MVFTLVDLAPLVLKRKLDALLIAVVIGMNVDDTVIASLSREVSDVDGDWFVECDDVCAGTAADQIFDIKALLALVGIEQRLGHFKGIS